MTRHRTQHPDSASFRISHRPSDPPATPPAPAPPPPRSRRSRRARTRSPHRRGGFGLGVAVALASVLCASASSALPIGPGAPAGATSPREAERSVGAAAVTLPGGERWSWPIAAGVRVTAPFLAPPHAYGTGHRGIDLASLGDGPRVPVRAPADGVIAFVGTVVDRPLLTIDHGDGLVTTLEPVRSELRAGTVVHAREAVGSIASGGHTLDGNLHFGVRRDGEYINPLLLLGGVPRAILLPCCSADEPP